MKYFLWFLLLFLSFYRLDAQPEIDIRIVPITPYQIGEATLDREAFFVYTDEIREVLESFFKKNSINREVKAQFNLRPDSTVSINIAARPVLEDGERKRLQDQLNRDKVLISRFTDYVFEVTITINGGVSDPYLSFEPAIKTPLQEKMKRFDLLSLKDKRIALKKWVFYEVIPVLIYHETAAKENYQAVRSIGKILLEQRFMKEPVENLTDHNPAYWQAIIELEKGNQLIPFTKVCMLLAKGEFDRAIRLLEVIRLFSARESLPAQYFEEILEKLASIDRMLNEKMQKPLNYFENGKYKKAEEIYQELLTALPKSARIHCELFYAKAAQLKRGKAIDELWQESSKNILGHDPLYPVRLNAITAEEAYMIQRRQQVATLFQSGENLKEDLITYAYIAMEQEYYSLAGQLFWLINLYFTPEDSDGKDMSLYFLYCLQQLGDEQIILAYQGSYAEAFSKIEKERLKRMRKSEVYRNFRNK